MLDTAEIAALSADVAAAVERARPDDRKSWWTTVDGREVCNRVNYLNEGSDRIAALGADPRFLDIAALGGNDLRDAHDRLDGNGVVIKVPGSSGVWPTSPGIAIAAWAATPSSAPCSTSGSSSMPPRQTPGSSR